MLCWQIHGAARDTIEAGVKAMEVELNSAESGPPREDSKSAGAYDSTVVDVISKNMKVSMTTTTVSP